MSTSRDLVRRAAMAAVALYLASPALAREPGRPSSYSDPVRSYERGEIVAAVSDFFGVTAEAASQAVERLFRDFGEPVAYVAGEEISGAAGVGLRYGEGWLTMKGGGRRKVHWRGPSIGFDVGGDASRVFALVYGLDSPGRVFRRYPGVQGSAFYVGGIGATVHRADGITIAPMRAGVGLRAGASVGYMAISQRRTLNPF